MHFTSSHRGSHISWWCAEYNLCRCWFKNVVWRCGESPYIRADLSMLLSRAWAPLQLHSSLKSYCLSIPFGTVMISAGQSVSCHWQVTSMVRLGVVGFRMLQKLGNTEDPKSTSEWGYRKLAIKLQYGIILKITSCHICWTCHHILTVVRETDYLLKNRFLLLLIPFTRICHYRVKTINWGQEESLTVSVTACANSVQPPSSHMLSLSQTQYLQCAASEILQTQRLRNEQSAMKELPIVPLPTPAYSIKHMCDRILSPHRALGSLCSMPWRSYWQVTKMHDDEQCGITSERGLWCTGLSSCS